jgi:hypothetical protein
MKYMAIIMLDRNSQEAKDYEAGVPTDPKFEAAMGKYVEELTKSGVLLDAAGLLPQPKGARIRAGGGKLTVIDGPFIESKEVLGGYALLRVKSKEEAIETGKAFMKIHLDVLGPSYEGILELRQMFDPADFATEGAKH